MAMDIETFVEARGRKALVSEVRKRIDALGIEYLYLQFVSVTGRIMGKGIPADHWESVSEKGFQLVYGATMNLFLNRRGEPLNAKVPHGHWTTMTFLAALRHDRIAAPCVFDGPINGQSFLA